MSEREREREGREGKGKEDEGEKEEGEELGGGWGKGRRSGWSKGRPCTSVHYLQAPQVT